MTTSRFLTAFFTVRGGAPYAQAELADFGITATPTGADYLLAETTTAQTDLVHLRGQTITRVLRLLGKPASFNAIPTLINALTDAATPAALKPHGSFCLRATGEDRQEWELEFGGMIQTLTQAPVNLSKPDTTYLLTESDGAWLLGVDLFGDLSKRHYKIITGAHSLTGPFATCALRASGWKPTEDLVVWPCGAGELAIEAALWAVQKSPRGYQLKDLSEKATKIEIVAADPKLPLVRSCEKNSKVAGVHKIIRFSRQDADWLDTKYDEHGINHLVGLLPNITFHPKLIGELFYQLEYILKPGGVACFLCVNDASAEKLEAGAEKDAGYDVRREYLWMGQQGYTLVLLTRKKPRRKQKKPE